MKKFIGAAMLAGAAISAAGTAHAQDGGSFSGSVTMTTDYVFRGLSQTMEGPAVQGSFDYTNGIFYAGAWGSNVDFGVDESMELDLYAGLTPTTGPVSWDLAVIGYFYPNSTDALGEYDFFEAKVGAGIDVTEQFSLGGAVFYSPEFFGETGQGVYLEVNGAFAFNDMFSVSGAYGNQDIDDLGDYSTWNLGGTVAAHGFEFDVRYHDTDGTGLDEIINLTISRAL